MPMVSANAIPAGPLYTAADAGATAVTGDIAAGATASAFPVPEAIAASMSAFTIRPCGPLPAIRAKSNPA